MKKYLFVTLIVCGFYSNAQEINPQMDSFLKKMEGNTLEEIKISINEVIEEIKTFSIFFNVPDEESKNIPKIKEKYGTPFKTDTSIVKKAIKQFSNMEFSQVFKDFTTQLKFTIKKEKFWSKINLPEGIEEELEPVCIYYNDGKVKTDKVTSYVIRAIWEEDWGEAKPIDSIAVAYHINYAKKYDSLTLTSKTKKIKYKDGIIKVKALKDNYIYFTVSDAFTDKIYVRALNEEGKILDFRSSSSSNTLPKKTNIGMVEILNILEDAKDKLYKDKFATVPDFRKYLFESVKKTKTFKDTDGVYHYTYFFEGNISSLKLYIGTDFVSQTILFSITKESELPAIIHMPTPTENIFFDHNMKELFRLDAIPITSLGARFYQKDKTFYHLNLSKKKLDSLSAFNIFEAKNGIGFIQQDSDTPYVMVNAENEQLSDLFFTNIYALDNTYVHAQGVNKMNYIIDTIGNVKTLPNIEEVIILSEGRLLSVSKDNRMGFLDTSGKTIIPFDYKKAKAFSEGLAVVQNQEGFYGYIDKKGTIQLPFKYQSADSFQNGIAIIRFDHKFHLIDKKGNILATSNSGGYNTNGSGVKKTYLFGKKKYDAYGKLITKDD
ncbi:WG repeat-containing protein [Aquimarina spinulae]|uniref:WG repeat-containing protein n=1 Tax=Aquimarina spinulae TaxID=1192023 RepID=UPI000D554491|nr:WG repeat-containing protein [Aquimarina spinulae]